MKFHTTKLGTKLPITNLKGKDYLMVGFRILWFREENPEGSIQTEIVQLGADFAIVKAHIYKNINNIQLLVAQATKKEDLKGFGDFIEKAETGAVGRALALAGYGTQFSLPELDEGERLADAPLVSVGISSSASQKTGPDVTSTVTPIKKSSSFRAKTVVIDDNLKIALQKDEPKIEGWD